VIFRLQIDYVRLDAEHGPLLTDDEILEQVLEPIQEHDVDSHENQTPRTDTPPPIAFSEAAMIYKQALDFLYQQGEVIGVSPADVSVVRKITRTINLHQIQQRKQKSLDQFFHSN
jgi:hypothetical protein